MKKKKEFVNKKVTELTRMPIAENWKNRCIITSI